VERLKRLDVYKSLVPSKISSIKIVVEELICNLNQRIGDLDEYILFELRVILNELLVNAIKHGNRDDESKNIKVVAGIDEQKDLFVSVEDEGCGYDFANTCDNLKPYCGEIDSLDVSECAECGRGILIIKSLCDRVLVNDKGNKTVIHKRLLKARPEANQLL
jgi:serine/threonine-protein kinase RsbW